jgi:hypothetical protein
VQHEHQTAADHLARFAVVAVCPRGCAALAARWRAICAT